MAASDYNRNVFVNCPFDRRYRYQQFMSDISGQDVEAHGDDYNTAITVVRNWLKNQSGRAAVPGGQRICQRYHEFRAALPAICERLQYDPEDQLPFNDFRYTVAFWLRQREAGGAV